MCETRYYRCMNYMCFTHKITTHILYVYHTCNKHVARGTVGILHTWYHGAMKKSWKYSLFRLSNRWRLPYSEWLSITYLSSPCAKFVLVFQLVVGAMSFLWPRCNVVNRSMYKAHHVLWGMIIFILAIINIQLGIVSYCNIYM